MVFGGSAHYPPFEWLDDEGRAQGFLVDIKEAIARSGGRRPIHRLTEWPQGLAALDRGDVDVVAMFYSEPRARKYLFTEPFYYVVHAIYGPPGTLGVTGPESLDGMKVAIVDEGYAESILTRLVPGAQVVPRTSIDEALGAVAGGSAQVALVAKPTAARFVERREFDLQPLGPPFWPRRYVFAVPRDNPELFDWLARNLRTVVAEGRYHDIYADWQERLEWSQPSTVDYVKRAGAIILPIALFGIIGYLWSWQLHRRVASATGELQVELARRASAEEKLRYRVRHDALTDLPTRNEFIRRSERVLPEPGAHHTEALIATVKLVELDRVISAFGYETGEQLLAEFGARLRQMGFAVVGDFGRGVFGVLVVDDVEPRQVLRVLTAPVDLGQIELDPHFSIGIARYPEQGSNIEELIRKAETALADASSRNRPWVQYAGNMEPDPQDLIIVRDFRRLGAEGLYPVFQPLIDLDTMQMVGAEALIRWRHPEFGLIEPDRFIPLLESAGIVYRVTRYIIREAARTTVELEGEGLKLPISLNISAVDLLEGELKSLIEGVLREFKLDPGLLRLEMTETSVIEDPDGVRQVVAELGSLGIRCGIDDFGVGYSSLSYLSKFPVSEVKIDRSFVKDMLENERHETIVRSTIAMAHELQLDVVAEGVEDWRTIAALRKDGCDRAQGFVLSRPVAGDKLLGLAGRKFGADSGQD